MGPPRPHGSRFRVPTDLTRARIVLPGPGSDIRSQFDLWYEKHRLRVDIAAKVDDMAMLRLLARDSGAAIVLPEVVAQDEPRERRLQRYCSVPGVF